MHERMVWAVIGQTSIEDTVEDVEAYRLGWVHCVLLFSESYSYTTTQVFIHHAERRAYQWVCLGEPWETQAVYVEWQALRQCQLPAHPLRKLLRERRVRLHAYPLALYIVAFVP